MHGEETDVSPFEFTACAHFLSRSILVHRFVNTMTYLLTQELVLSKQLCLFGQ